MKLIDFVNLPEINTISFEQVTSLNKDIASKTIKEINEIVPNHLKPRLDEHLTNAFVYGTVEASIHSKLTTILDSLRETSE